MVAAFAFILLFQLLGEVISRGVGLPLPGPVLGMIFMLLGLFASARLRELVQPTAKGLLSHLSLLFVPVGVGVVAHLHTLTSHGLALGLSLFGSTALALMAGAAAFAITLRLTKGGRGK
ncbi:CidA/LrgA family protein [Thioclava sp. GXIMD4215]|uniref:CidA/LrgA family protein n=1 Tax=Thioclava sp. GXIMD4215 TaxID=3131928 RepID=UPI003246508F